MLTFPLLLILIPYALFFLLFIIFVWINIYHIVLFGSMSATSFFATFIFLGVSAYILFLTWDLLAVVDWGAKITIFKGWGGGEPFVNF